MVMKRGIARTERTCTYPPTVEDNIGKSRCKRLIITSSGCGNTLAAGSYGKVFNDNDGGVYVTWLTENAVRIYWWKRSQIPPDIKAGRPDPSKWGRPAARFTTGDNCDVKKYFKGLTIVSFMICSCWIVCMLTSSDHQHCSVR